MTTTRLASFINTGDADTVLNLVHEAIANTREYDTRVKDMEIMFNTPEIIEQHIDNGLCVVALIDDEIVGTCFGEDEGGVVWLGWVAVKPEYQRRAVGEALIEKFIDVVRGGGIRPPLGHKIACSTLISNSSSVNLFRKMGFRQVTLLYNHWHNLDFYLWDREL